MRGISKWGWYKDQQTPKAKEIVIGPGKPKDVTKAHGNVRMEWAKDAQRNEMRQGNPRWHED